MNRPWSSTVMIGSISVGLALSTIMFAFIDRENKTDAFHNKMSNIYRLLSNDPFVESGDMAYVSSEIPSFLVGFPEVQASTSVTELRREGVTIEQNQRSFKKSQVIGIDKSFFHLFDFGLQGSPSNNTLGDYEIVLSKEYAQRVFGEPSPLGKELIVSYDTIAIPLQVVGVLDPMIDNSHFQFDALVSLQTFNKKVRGFSTYLHLQVTQP